MREHNNDTQLVTGRQLNILYFMVAYMLGMTDWLQLATYSLREHDYPHSSEGSLLPTPHINDPCMEATFFIEAKYQLLQNHINWLQLLLQNAAAAALPARDCLNSILNQVLKFQYCLPPGIYFSQIDPSTTRLDRLKWWERTESMCRQG